MRYQRRGPSKRTDLYLIGASGHGKVLADVAVCDGRFRVCGFFDDSSAKSGLRIGGIPILGTTRSLAAHLRGKRALVIVAIGSNRVRGQKADDAVRQGATLGTLVHPGAIVASDVRLGEGTVVMAGAVVNSGACVGRNVIINTGATVDHDCSLGDNVHISPGANLAGSVRVGHETHVGIGAVVIQDIQIGARCVIGAGAVVIRDVPAGATVVGNPAHPLKRSERRK